MQWNDNNLTKGYYEWAKSQEANTYKEKKYENQYSHPVS